MHTLHLGISKKLEEFVVVYLSSEEVIAEAANGKQKRKSLLQIEKAVL